MKHIRKNIVSLMKVLLMPLLIIIKYMANHLSYLVLGPWIEDINLFLNIYELK